MRRLVLTTLTVTALAAPGAGVRAQAEAGGLETRVWLDQGDDPVLRRGETVRIYYRTSEDAYAAIFRIDTDGRISMIFPADPRSDGAVDGGRDYRLLLPGDMPVWRVGEDPGVGYFFMVASPEPLDFSAFPFDPTYGWDLGAVGDVVYEDPYVAIDDYVAQLIPDWEVVPYALDFITYNVGDTYTYPRFLCYDCHEARPYASWNPYAVPCTSVRVVIWDDPYFYPSYRYWGTRVLVPRRLVTQPRYALAVRTPGDSYRPLIRSRQPPPRIAADFKEPPGTVAPSAAARRASPQPNANEPSPRPTLQRRPTTPSSRLPVRTPPSSGRASPPAPGGSTQDPRIVRPTRPSSPSSGAAPRPSGRATPTPSGGSVPGTRVVPSTRRPSARPSAPSSRPSARPSAPSRPTARPSAPPRSSPRPSAPSRPSARPSAPSSRPTARPSRPSTTSRPTVRPRSND